jgi:hypothetical protein
MRWSRLPVLLLTTLLWHSGAPAQPTDLQPVNGGFEQLDGVTGLPLGWTPWNPGRNLTAYTLATAHSGVAAASVTDDNGTDSQGLRSPRVPITAGQTYRATGQVWITDLTAGSFSIYLEFWHGGERLANNAASTTEAGRWAELQVQQTAPPGATEATVLIYGSSATVGHAYFDDVSLKPAAP